MKKLLWSLGAAALILLLATLIAPSLILRAATQPEPETGFAYSDSFCTEYEQVRSRIAGREAALRAEGLSPAVYRATDGYHRHRY